MSISIKETERLALLSRLSLNENEKERFAGEMSSLIDMAGKLSELDVSNVEPTMHAADIYNVFREDTVTQAYPVSIILQNAPESDEGCFVVPKAVE